MVQQNNSASESTQNNSQEFASNGKDEINALRDEIESHLHKISLYMEYGETRYAFHEADTASVKLRQLCDMEEKSRKSETCPLCFEQIDDKSEHGSWCK